MLTEYNGIADPTSNASCYVADFRLSGTAIPSNRAANSCNKLGTRDAEMNWRLYRNLPSSRKCNNAMTDERKHQVPHRVPRLPAIR